MVYSEQNAYKMCQLTQHHIFIGIYPYDNLTQQVNGINYPRRSIHSEHIF